MVFNSSSVVITCFVDDEEGCVSTLPSCFLSPLLKVKLMKERVASQEDAPAEGTPCSLSGEMGLGGGGRGGVLKLSRHGTPGIVD